MKGERGKPRRGGGAPAATPTADAEQAALRSLRQRAVKLLWLVIPVGAVIAAHRIVLESLVGSVLIAKLLAPNPSEAAQAFVVGGLFLALRVFVLALLPPLVLATVGVALIGPAKRWVCARVWFRAGD